MKRLYEQRLPAFVRDFLNSRKIRYLLVGGLNTLFGYLVGVGVYKLMSHALDVWVIGIVSNMLAISFSFVTYKLFVFKTAGQWLQEYLKAYSVYGAMAIVGIALLWLYVEVLSLSIWLAQGIVIVSTVALSYIGHSKITFRRKEI